MAVPFYEGRVTGWQDKAIFIPVALSMSDSLQ
jgi:hypothetical protein